MLFWALRNKVDMQNVRMPDAGGLSARDFAVLVWWGSMQCSLVPSMGFQLELDCFRRVWYLPVRDSMAFGTLDGLRESVCALNLKTLGCLFA